MLVQETTYGTVLYTVEIVNDFLLLLYRTDCIDADSYVHTVSLSYG